MSSQTGDRSAPATLIVVAGNIAAGKSTVARAVATELDAQLFLESVEDNPFLERYYADMASWTFHLNMYFLAHRARQLQDAVAVPRVAVLDRSFYEDRIFVEQARDEGRTTPDTYAVFAELDRTLAELLPPPAVLVYLSASPDVLFGRVLERGRVFEADVSESVLSDLQRRYDRWISQYDLSPVLRVDTTAVDLSVDAEELGNLAQEIRRLVGLG